MRLLVSAAVVAAALTLTACDSEAGVPGASRVDVDTPDLAKIKRATDVPDCVPGDGSGGGLPDVTLPCLGGGSDVDLSTLEGPLMVNLWASWCGPCRTETPILQAFHEEYGDQVRVLGIDYQDQQPAAALELAKESGVTYPLLADPGGDLNAADPLPVIRGLPHLVFLDEDGDVTFVTETVDSVDDLVDLANEHLGTDL